MLRFLINHNDDPVTVPLVEPVEEILGGKMVETGISLEPNGVAVLKKG